MKYNYNRTDVYGVAMNMYLDWAAGRTALGGELRNEDLVSGNLGEPLSETHHISGTDRDYTLGSVYLMMPKRRLMPETMSRIQTGINNHNSPDCVKLSCLSMLSALSPGSRPKRNLPKEA